MDPLRDIETINLELIFSDIEILDRRIAKNGRGAANNKALAKEVELLKSLKAHLEDGKLAKSFPCDDEDTRDFINTLNLLTWKPVIFAANVSEDDLADDGASNEYVNQVRGFAAENDSEVFNTLNLLTWKPVIFAANVSEDDLADDGASNEYVNQVRGFAAENDSEVFVICAQIEQEIAELDDDEKKEFLEDLGLKESGLEKLIAASYRLLGLISYLTAGEKETRAWTIKVGTKAPQAAGKIHSDFERGFIKAEVVNYQDLLDCGSYSAAKEKGLVRIEGKEYVVKDGDVVLFRFNV